MAHKKRGRRGRVQQVSRSLGQPNLWVVLSVAVLMVGLTVITTLGPSSVTGNTIQTIGIMNEGDPLQLGVRDIPALQTIFTHAEEKIKYGKITAEADESIPFDRPYVSKFKVSSEGKFGPLQFTFRINERDMLDKGISRYDLRLYNGVKEYPLQLLKIDHGYLYYIVTVPEMGNFVLGRIEAVEKEVVAAEKEVVEAPAVEEQAAEVVVEEAEQEPLVGKAAEQSAPEMEEKGFFARIAAFFRNLFK